MSFNQQWILTKSQSWNVRLLSHSVCVYWDLNTRLTARLAFITRECGGNYVAYAAPSRKVHCVQRMARQEFMAYKVHEISRAIIRKERERELLFKISAKKSFRICFLWCISWTKFDRWCYFCQNNVMSDIFFNYKIAFSVKVYSAVTWNMAYFSAPGTQSFVNVPVFDQLFIMLSGRSWVWASSHLPAGSSPEGRLQRSRDLHRHPLHRQLPMRWSQNRVFRRPTSRGIVVDSWTVKFNRICER